jgi:hypothetical protein
MAVYLYRFARLLIREVVLRRFGQLREHFPAFASGRHKPALYAFITAVMMWLNIPLIVTSHISMRLAYNDLHRVYAVDPAPSGPLGPQWVGLFYVDTILVQPTGVNLYIRDAGSIKVDPDEMRIEPRGWVGFWGARWFSGGSLWR